MTRRLPRGARLVVASHNSGKVREILDLVAPHGLSVVSAAELGLPFAFASHFAPDYLHAALGLYHENFKPSDRLAEPLVMVAASAFAADTDAEARRLFTSLQQQFLNMVRGRPGQLPPPVDSMDGRWNDAERAHVEWMTRVSAVGSVAQAHAVMRVKGGWEGFVDPRGSGAAVGY